MLYILIAIACNTMMMFVMRYSEAHQGNRYATTLFNYVAGVVVSFLLLEEKVLFHNSPEGWFAMGLALFNAVCMVGGMFLNQINVGLNGAPMTATFGKMSVLIPTVVSIFLFGEIPAPLQLAGLALAVFAIVYINGGKGESHIKSLPLLLGVFVVVGLVELNSKLYGEWGVPQLQTYYVFYSFLFNMLISLVLLLRNGSKVKKQDVINGVLIGIPNQLVTFCIVRAVLYMPAYVAFPLNSAGVILAVNVANFLVFRERPSKRELAATCLIGVALVLLNI